MNINEVIQKRKSVRKYEKTNVNQDVLSEIEKDLDNYVPVFSSSKVRFEIIRNEEMTQNVKLGFLFGIGKIDAPCCIVGIYEDNQKGNQEIGFALEQEVLKLTQLGYGTCWLKTFDKELLTKLCNVTKEEEIGVVIAVGIEKQDDFMNSKFRKLAGSKKRKSISEICLNESQENMDKQIIDMIKLSILAPSANNAQPVRIGIDNNRADFYLTNESMIDTGIFISHFYLLVKEQYNNVKIIVEKPNPKCYNVNNGHTYIASIMYD